MSTIGKLFGRSPFHLVQRHMNQVSKCIDRMNDALDAFSAGAFDQLGPLAKEVSKLEHQADQIKDDVRNHLFRRFFMPVDRSQVLEVLSLQDQIADTAEDICVLLTMKQILIHAEFADGFRKFRDLNFKTFQLAVSIIDQLDELVETGFGGAEADKIRTIAHDVAFHEHQVDVVQQELLHKIYAMDDRMSMGEFYLWMQITRTLSVVSNTSENLADRILMTLSLK